MTDRTHDELAELTGVYALDALDGEELEAFEAHLPTCPRCRAEVAEHREVAALLAHAGATAPEGLWDRIASHLEAPPPALTLAPVGRSAPAPAPAVARPRVWSRVATAALAAAAVVVIGVLGVQVNRLDERVEQQAAVMAQDGLMQEYLAARDSDDAQRTELLSEDGLDVEVVVAEDGRGFVNSAALPVLPEGRTYQLWGDTGEDIISLGVLGSDPSRIFTFTANERLVGLMITDEAAPGVVWSAQPPVVEGELT